MINDTLTRSLFRSKMRLRERVLTRRNDIPTDERARRSSKLCEQLMDTCRHALKPFAVVAAYFPSGSEPDIRSFLRGAYAFGCRVCLPCMVRGAAVEPSMTPLDAPKVVERARMTFLEVNRSTLDAGDAPFLVQPVKALSANDPLLAPFHIIQPGEIDVVVVPMVAFDASNNRMGYGGGNYDRFLGLLRGDTLVVGAAFAEQKVDVVPVEPHDIPLPRIEIA